MTDGTTHDFIGCTVASAVFAGVLYVPGYLVCHAANLFHFRSRSREERTCWSIAVSFAAVPFAAYMVGRFISFAFLCSTLEALAVCFCVLRGSQLRNLRNAIDRQALARGAIVIAWVCFVQISLVDVQVGHKLFFSVVQFDQSYRVAFTNAVLRTGVPPANPLYFAGHLQTMRYYYFWYVICAAVARLAHVSAQQAFIASSIWTGFGVVATILLFLRHTLGITEHLRRYSAVAIGLLCVTGADLIPAIGSIFAQPALNGEMEWWSIDQFYSWQDSILWVPHHTASLLCCLLAFLLLWRTQEDLSRPQMGTAFVLAAVSFGSAFGLSIYVAFGFVLLMVAWLLSLALPHRRNGPLSKRLLVTGAVSAILLSPFLHELLATNSTVEGGAHARPSRMFTLSVRRMIDPELVTHLPSLAGLERTHPLLLDQGVRLLLLLPGLALELGFYGAVFVLFLLAKHRSPKRLDPARKTLLFLSGTGLLIVLFIRSSVISNNDFGYRASLFPQFFLLLLGTDLLASWWIPARAYPVPITRWKRRTIYALLALGLMGTVYQALMLRLFIPLEDMNRGSGFEGLPERMYQARRALTTMNVITPQNSVLVFNPTDPRPSTRGDVVSPYTFFTRSILMNADRQLLNAEPTCASEFGGDPAPCPAIEQSLRRLYAIPAMTSSDARQFCNQFGVHLLLASDLDPIWTDPHSWSSTLPTVASEPDLRIVQCAP